MNFIKETDRYARQLEAWQKGHGFSDLEALQDLANLWDEFKNIPERRAVIYIGALGVPPKTDIGCGNCVQDMLQMVVNWRKILEHEVTVEFKGVPQAVVIFNNQHSDESKNAALVIKDQNNDYFSVNINTGRLEPIVTDNNDTPKTGIKKDEGLVKLDQMKMHQVRSLAKSKGIDYTNKTKKEELIKAINEKQ